MTAVVIVGGMRTGTSLASATVHRLGYQASLAIGAPVPPAWRSDWEDLNLAVRLMMSAEIKPDWFRQYIHDRRTVARLFGFRDISIKSPYLALHWANFRSAFDEDPIVLKCIRSNGRAKSLDAYSFLDKQQSESIDNALDRIEADLVLKYEDAIACPVSYVERIAERLGVEDLDAITAAAKEIGEPTRY